MVSVSPGDPQGPCPLTFDPAHCKPQICQEAPVPKCLSPAFHLLRCFSDCGGDPLASSRTAGRASRGGG